MIVRKHQDVVGTNRDVRQTNWNSVRLLLKSDGMGFSLHDTVLYAGTETQMCYRNHVEAVYCIEGEGTLVDISNDKTHPISPGTMYALDGHEEHILKAQSQLRMICVFNPPVTGDEVHDESGAYPLVEE